MVGPQCATRVGSTGRPHCQRCITYYHRRYFVAAEFRRRQSLPVQNKIGEFVSANDQDGSIWDRTLPFLDIPRTPKISPNPTKNCILSYGCQDSIVADVEVENEMVPGRFLWCFSLKLYEERTFHERSDEFPSPRKLLSLPCLGRSPEWPECYGTLPRI